MSLSSMTGFGQAEHSTPSGSYRVEIRGVNNRYLDIQIRSPRSFANLEQKIKKILGKTISRGSLTVNIAWGREDEDCRMGWDKKKVASYIGIFRQIQKAHKLSGDVAIGNLLQFSDFIKVENVEYNETALWRHIKPVLDSAIADFQKSRQAEAEIILRDLKKMVRQLTDTLNQIMKRAPKRLQQYKKVLEKRIESLASSNIEPQRLATEVAILADRLDISEECTRLKAHIEKFHSDLTSKEPAGKRMTFILQEMNREANTIASKANDTIISHHSVTLKEIIEKLREQAQNIE